MAIQIASPSLLQRVPSYPLVMGVLGTSLGVCR